MENENKQVVINNIYNYYNDKLETGTKNDKKFPLTEEQMKKVLVILANIIVPKEETLSDEQRGSVHDMIFEIEWDIADYFGVDINTNYYDVDTLEVKQY